MGEKKVDQARETFQRTYLSTCVYLLSASAVAEGTLPLRVKTIIAPRL